MDRTLQEDQEEYTDEILQKLLFGSSAEKTVLAIDLVFKIVCKLLKNESAERSKRNIEIYLSNCLKNQNCRDALQAINI